MISLRRNPWTFLLGLGLAFLPAYAPFVGVFVLLGARWQPRRLDLVWFAAALLVGIPLAAHSGVDGFLFGVLQILAPWLIFRAFEQFYYQRTVKMRSRQLGWGLVVGLALVVTLALLQIDQFNFGTAKTVAQAIAWASHPNLYGHAILTLGTLLALLLPGARMRVISLGLAAMGIMLVGSREAALAWVLVAGVFLLIRFPRNKRSHAAEMVLLAVMLALTAGLGPWLGWGRVGFLVDVVPTNGSASNLIQGSEIPYGDWWDPMGVEVDASTVTLGGDAYTAYTLTKLESEGWRRLQQVVRLAPQEPYTISAWIRADDENVIPGIQGWAQPSADGRTLTVSGSLRGERWRAGVNGPGQIVDTGIDAYEGDWRRVWFTLVYTGEASGLDLWLGFTPDQRDSVGTSASFAGFQVVPGEALTSYTPGVATRGLGLAEAREPYWRAAWQGIRERPLLGRGQGSFPAYYRQVWPGRDRLQQSPAHVHNLFLQFLFERGLVGTLGLLLLLGALSQAALRRRDIAFLTVFGALLIANMFDYTLLYGGVIYPLAAVAGWRAASYRALRDEPRDLSKQLTVGIALPFVDYVMVALSLVLAYGTRSLLTGLMGLEPLERSLAEAWPTLSYLLLLWPAVLWREGLYPGYALALPEQLKRQVSGVVFAGLIVAAATFVVGEQAVVGRGVLILMVLYAVVLCPFARALTKRALLNIGAWGREVVVLGAGATGSRIVKALQQHPMEGLKPIAFFDDDPAKQGKRIAGLNVRGPLEAASGFAEEHQIEHAIVAIPRVPRAMLMALIGPKGRAFKRVQFIPDLAGLPSTDVMASRLDTQLALELRRGLRLRRNRWAKRVIDLVGGTVALLLAAPILLTLYIWIRRDSKGPAFYASDRLGQHGQVFSCLKFRSMYLDAEERLQEMLAHDEQARAEYQVYHKLGNDPRITKVGQFIRRYSLDELPQLFNVLRGDLSLVGPRPYLKRELPDMLGYEETILEAKPGITGYWQITGRNEVTFEDRLHMETHYVRNWSIWWDVIILFQTVGIVLARKGAR